MRLLPEGANGGWGVLISVPGCRGYHIFCLRNADEAGCLKCGAYYSMV